MVDEVAVKAETSASVQAQNSCAPEVQMPFLSLHRVALVNLQPGEMIVIGQRQKIPSLHTKPQRQSWTKQHLRGRHWSLRRLRESYLFQPYNANERVKGLTDDPVGENSRALRDVLTGPRFLHDHYNGEWNNVES